MGTYVFCFTSNVIIFLPIRGELSEDVSFLIVISMV